MIFKAFLAIADVMKRLCLSDDDIEIVIRCKTAAVDRDLRRLIEDEVFISGNHVHVDEPLKRSGCSGKIYGVPFRIEAKH